MCCIYYTEKVLPLIERVVIKKVGEKNHSNKISQCPDFIIVTVCCCLFHCVASLQPLSSSSSHRSPIDPSMASLIESGWQVLLSSIFFLAIYLRFPCVVISSVFADYFSVHRIVIHTCFISLVCYFQPLWIVFDPSD